MITADKIRAAKDAAFEAQEELLAAMRQHPRPFSSAHEGHAVIREEFEELWDEIKVKHPDRAKMRKEALQLAAMGLRFLVDLDLLGEEPI